MLYHTHFIPLYLIPRNLQDKFCTFVPFSFFGTIFVQISKSNRTQVANIGHTARHFRYLCLYMKQFPQGFPGQHFLWRSGSVYLSFFQGDQTVAVLRSSYFSLPGGCFFSSDGI